MDFTWNDQWKVDKSRHLFGDMVYTPKGETNALFIFWPHSCFYTFFYLSIWNPLINSYFYEYCKPFSACLWSLLKAKWTYFQHVLISSKSENNSVSFEALRKYFLWFLPKHLFCGKLRWKCTGMFFERNFLWSGVFYRCYPAEREQATCSGRQIIEICPEIFSKAEYAEECE